MKLVKNLAILTYLIMFFLSLLLITWEAVMSYRISFTFIYWEILIGWIYIVFKLRRSSLFSLMTAFVFFIIGATLAVFGLWNVAETFMNLCLIGYLLGVLHALLEIKGKQKKSN